MFLHILNAYPASLCALFVVILSQIGRYRFFRYLSPKGRCIKILKSFSYASVSASIIETSHINVSGSSYKVPGKTVVTIPNVTFRENASGGSRFFLCERAD
jgi:hypothetical protein